MRARAGVGSRLASRVRHDRLHLSVVALLVVVSFAQRIGETTFDTKFDLTADPVAALHRAFTLWGTESNFGGVANQRYGYLFPQGPWFALGHLAGSPDWVTQRLWSALILLLAYDGARRLARALGIGTSAVPVVVGLTYALTPRILGLSGLLSSEVLPSSMLPWVCLPVVLALRGRISARRAGVLAGIAVLGMGGVNAVENLATLPLPFLLVLSGIRSRPGRRLAAWWAAATALAALWWMLPLLLLGKYSPPFLDYIETAANTTRTTGWSNAVRGAEHWLNYLTVGGGIWWPAAHTLSAAPALVLGAGLVAALGFAGMAHRSMPYRVPFGLSALLGLICLVAGHGGPAGSPLAGSVRDLLDGPLAPFRNVHKVDPLIRLPISLGFGVLCLVLAEAVRRSARMRAGVERISPGRLRHVGVAVAVLALLAGSAPMFSDQLRHPGWDRVPQAWKDAAAWLDHDGPGTTLVVPSSGIGQQTWGWTVDEPIQGLADSDWAVRTQVPLVPAPTIRMLDAFDQRLEDGGGSSALAGALAAAGISRVLLRNDLDVAAGDVAEPARVATALNRSIGLTRVRDFGSTGIPGVPMLEVYRVDQAAATPELAPSELPLITGGPEDVLSAREAGLIGPREHVRIGVAASGQSPDVVGDGYRRVERNYGRLHGAVSQVMTADEPTRLHRKATDYPGVAGVPRVVARYDELRDVVASTSAGYADTLGPTRPELGPAAAVDGDPSTYWSSAPFVDPVGQWVRLDLDHPRPIGEVSVQAGVTDYLGAPVRRIAVQAGSIRREVSVDPLTGKAVVDVGQVVADRVTVTVLAVGRHDPGTPVILRDIVVTGLDQRRTLVVPDTGADAWTSFVFTAQAPRRACLQTVLGPSCDIGEARPGEEQSLLSRTFTVHAGGDWQLSGQVVALPGAATARTLLPLGDAIGATSDSVLGGDPMVAPMFAVDGKPETSWLAQAGDRTPAITLSWKQPRRISRLQVDPSLVAAAQPSSAVIEDGNGHRRTVALGSGQLGYFAPFRTKQVTITFATSNPADRKTLPIGVGEIRLTGVEDLVHPIATAWNFTGLCGFGPQVRIDGTSFATRVSGNLDDIVFGRPLRWTTCGSQVHLGAGTHLLEAHATDTFTPTQLVLGSEMTSAPIPGSPSRTLTATKRADVMRFHIGPGDRAVLVLGQNTNAGWKAEFDGKPLTAEVVDGWQQGFAIPAGAGGDLVVRFAPASVYRAALGIGAAGALLLVLLLLLDLIRPRPILDEIVAPRPSRRLSAAALVTGVVVAGLLAGPVFEITLVLGVLACRVLARTVVVTAGATLVAASAVVAVAGGGLGTGAPVAAADVVAALGVGLLGATLSRFTEQESDRA